MKMKKFAMLCKSKTAAALSLVGLSAMAEDTVELYNTFTTEAVSKFESFISFMGPKVLVILGAILGIVLLIAAYNWVRKLFAKAKA